jgi:hypothetical protein
MMAERGYTDVQRVDAVAGAKIEKAARDRYMGIALILSADRSRFGPMIRNMENNYLTGIDQYPKTFDKAFGILLNWQAEHEASVGNYKSDGLAFATIDEEGVKRKKDGSVLKCFDCDGNHFRGDESCPKFDKSKKTEETGSTFLNAGFTEDDFSDGGEYETFVFVCDDDVGPDGKVDPHYILLDNQSTVDVFYNEQMLKNIHESGATVNIRTNAGNSRTSLRGHLPGYGDVWYDPNGIANILSLARVEKQCRVTYDTDAGGVFVVYKSDGTQRLFRRSKKGLFYCDGHTGPQRDSHGEYSRK